MKAAALLLTLALVPLGAADGYDAHFVLDEEHAYCEGRDDRTGDAWDSGDASYEWEIRERDQQCDRPHDVLGIRVEENGAAAVRAGYGERFEGRETAYSSSSRSAGAGGSRAYENTGVSQEGTRAKGAYVEAAGQRATLDVSRCEGQWSSWRSEETYEGETNRSFGRGHRETCAIGPHVRALGVESDVGLGSCRADGYDSGRDKPGAEDDSNETWDYRSCVVERELRAGGESITFRYWEGHMHDCRGAWNGTDHEVHCISYGGEWSGVQYEHSGSSWWLPYDGRFLGVEDDLMLLP